MKAYGGVEVKFLKIKWFVLSEHNNIQSSTSKHGYIFRSLPRPSSSQHLM